MKYTFFLVGLCCTAFVYTMENMLKEEGQVLTCTKNFGLMLIKNDAPEEVEIRTEQVLKLPNGDSCIHPSKERWIIMKPHGKLQVQYLVSETKFFSGEVSTKETSNITISTLLARIKDKFDGYRVFEQKLSFTEPPSEYERPTVIISMAEGGLCFTESTSSFQ